MFLSISAAWYVLEGARFLYDKPAVLRDIIKRTVHKMAGF
jgi:hypothetical protein